MKVVKTGIGILVMIGMAALYGCSASQQTPLECFAIEAGLCAGTYPPNIDQVQYMQCATAAAQACGVVGPLPTPIPPKELMSKYPPQ